MALRAADAPLEWHALAKDGADLPPEQAVTQESRQLVLPGELYDFEYKPTTGGPVCSSNFQLGS